MGSPRRIALTLAIVACLVVSVSAQAEPKPWSIAVPEGWSDVTEETMKTPDLAAFKRTLVEQGATVEMTAYGDATGDYMLLVMDMYVASIRSSMAELRAFEHAARERSNQDGSEVTYHEMRTPTMLESTHRVATTPPTVTRRIVGFEKRGGLHALAALCFGDPAVCDPLVASARVDAAPYRTLASLDQGESPIVRTISMILAAVVGLAMLGLVVMFVGRRRRSAGA